MWNTGCHIDQHPSLPWSPTKCPQVLMPLSVRSTRINILLDGKPCRGSSLSPRSVVLKNQSTRVCDGCVSLCRSSGTPSSQSTFFRCLSGDVITQFSLPQGLHLLDSEVFADSYNRQGQSLGYIGIWHRHLGFVIPLFLKTPRWIVERFATPRGVQAFDPQAARADFGFLSLVTSVRKLKR